MLRELLASFHIDTAQAAAALGRLDNAINHSAAALGGLLDAVTGGALLHGIKEFIQGEIELGSQVNDMSEKLGVGVKALQQFQFAAGLTGVNSESAGQALGFLNRNIGEALGGSKEAAEAFRKLGVSFKDKGGVRDVADMLPELADAFVNLKSPQEQTAMAMKLFGRSGAALLPLLKGGSEGLREMAKEFEELGGGMSKEFIENADRAGDEIDKLKFVMMNFKHIIAFQILPTVTGLVKRFQGWWKEIIKLTRETHILKVGMAMFGAAATAATLKTLVGLGKMLGLIEKSQGAFGSLIDLAKGGALAIAIAAAALAAEDLYGWLNGDDSLMGRLLDHTLGEGQSAKTLLELKSIVGELRTSLDTLDPVFDQLNDSFKEVFGFGIPGFRQLGLTIRDFVLKATTGLVWMLRDLLGTMGKLWSFFGKFVERSGVEGGVDLIKKFGQDMQKSGDLSSQSADIQKWQSLAFPADRHGGESVNNIDAINQHNKIDVQVHVQGGDPYKTGRAVGDAVKKATTEMNAAKAAANTGG